MRQILAGGLAAVCAAILSAGPALSAEVEIKGPHICCKQCVTIVGGILKKVDGVSNAKCDIKAKTISFTATDDKAAKAAFKALLDGGFYGSCAADGKDIKLDLPAGSKDKADAVAVKSVHVCCGQCEKAIKGVFKDAKVTFTDPSGPLRTVRVEGSDLAPAGVLEALRKAGFNGSAEK